jgi:hypothetical protein
MDEQQKGAARLDVAECEASGRGDCLINPTIQPADDCKITTAPDDGSASLPEGVESSSSSGVWDKAIHAVKNTPFSHDDSCNGDWRFCKCQSFITAKEIIAALESAKAKSLPESSQTANADLCAICHKPMDDPSESNAIFGAHEECLDQKEVDFQLAQATWDAICAETAKGGDRPSPDIIKDAFDLIRRNSAIDAIRTFRQNRRTTAIFIVDEKAFGLSN